MAKIGVNKRRYTEYEMVMLSKVSDGSLGLS